MTPDKTKKPLPSSASSLLLESPATYRQWNRALQLVKVLFLRGQWKQCVTRCDKLLEAAGTPVSRGVGG